MFSMTSGKKINIHKDISPCPNLINELDNKIIYILESVGQNKK